jgi:hypothetical protein
MFYIKCLGTFTKFYLQSHPTLLLKLNRKLNKIAALILLSLNMLLKHHLNKFLHAVFQYVIKLEHFTRVKLHRCGLTNSLIRHNVTGYRMLQNTTFE